MGVGPGHEAQVTQRLLEAAAAGDEDDGFPAAHPPDSMGDAEAQEASDGDAALALGHALEEGREGALDGHGSWPSSPTAACQRAFSSTTRRQGAAGQTKAGRGSSGP